MLKPLVLLNHIFILQNIYVFTFLIQNINCLLKYNLIYVNNIIKLIHMQEL